jgi:hypothetical protein
MRRIFIGGIILALLAVHEISIAQVIQDRSTLDSLLGSTAVTETFEGFNFSLLGGASIGVLTPLNSASTMFGQGPGLVAPGVSFDSSSGQLQWDPAGDGYASPVLLSPNVAINGNPNVPTTLDISFQSGTQGVGLDLVPWAPGVSGPATVYVYGTSGTQIAAIPEEYSSPGPVFFGYENTSGIGRVAVVSQNLPSQGLPSWTVSAITNVTWGSIPAPLPPPPQLPVTHILSFGVDWPSNGTNSGLSAGVDALQVSKAFGAYLGSVADNTAVDAPWNASNNLSELESAISTMGAKVHAGDLAIIYLGTHGTYDVSNPNQETPIQRQTPTGYVTTSVPSALALQGVVEQDGSLAVPSNCEIDAPTFANLFNNSDWEGVNKLFIIDSCYAGGFWAGPGGPSYLAGLDHSAIIAAASENYESYYTDNGQSQLSAALEEVLSAMSPNTQLDFPTCSSEVSTALAGIETASGNGFPEDGQVLWGGPAVPTSDDFFSEASSDFSLDLGGTAVPEPSATLLTMGALTALHFRRRGSRKHMHGF